MPAVLTDEQVEAWQTDGYVVVERFLDAEEVGRALQEARAHFPTREEYDRSKGEVVGDLRCDSCGEPFRLQAGMAFNVLPYKGDTLNTLPFHPRVLAAVEQLLGTDDLRLTQSLLRATYCGLDTVDQLLHRDYHDNSLLTPPKHGVEFEQLPVLIYLTDVGIGDAPTYVVSKRRSDDRPLVPHHLTKDEDPELYAHEVPNVGSAGTALFYSMRTWHRGSAGTDPNGFRIVHHAVYRKRGHEWMDFTAWPVIFDVETGQRCIERLTPRQRELLGIPAPGHPYWTEETVADFTVRYPAADVEPYLAQH